MFSVYNTKTADMGERNKQKKINKKFTMKNSEQKMMRNTHINAIPELPVEKIFV